MQSLMADFIGWFTFSKRHPLNVPDELKTGTV